MPSSPRSSADANQSPSSPFLQNLSQRLRKGSVASHASARSAEPASPVQEMHERAESAQSLKRHLLSIVRNDWEYPCTNMLQDSTLADRSPISYRTREESASDIDSDARPATGSKGNDPYKFDSPDAIAASVRERKRKRRRLIEEEMEFNGGLKHWAMQRDAWTVAIYDEPPLAQDGEHESGRRSSEQQLSHKRDYSDLTETLPEMTPATYQLPTEDDPPASSSSIEAEAFPSAETELSQRDYTDGPYLPIYPPLLPMSNSLRSRIKPGAYSTIYDKVVIQALTPNVPIPLTHMIGSLVAGWKAEGNWPPQPTAQMALATRKRKKGDSAFAKWRREQDEKRRLTMDPTALDARQGGRGMRKSISSAVKKVLGMDPEREMIEQDFEDIGLTFEDDSAQLDNQKVTDENAFLNQGLLETERIK